MRPIDLICGLFLAVGYIIFAFYTRKTKTFENYSVGSRNIGFFLLFASISATYIGPGFTMGLTSKGFDTGFFYFLIVIGYAFQIIIVGAFIAPKLRRKFSSNTFSIGDIIGGKLTHNNNGLRLFTGIISFGLILGFSIIMCSAAADMLNYFFGITKYLSIFIFTFIVVLYSFSGGIKASIYTDALQFSIFVIILPVLLFFLFYKQNIGISDVSERIVELTNIGFENHSTITIFGLIISFMFGELLLPPLIGRILSSKSEKTSKNSFIASGIFLIFWLIIMFLIGVLGSYSSNVPTSDTTLLELGFNFLPQGLFGVFIVAMIGVIMSSQDSLINYGSTIFTRDIVGLIKPKILNSDAKQLKISKLATILIGILSASFALFVPSVLEGLLLCYTVWVPTILVTLLASIFLNKTSVLGAYFSMTFGLIISLIWNFTFLEEVFPTIIIGLLVSLFSYFLGYKYDTK